MTSIAKLTSYVVVECCHLRIRDPMAIVVIQNEMLWSGGHLERKEQFLLTLNMSPDFH